MLAEGRLLVMLVQKRIYGQCNKIFIFTPIASIVASIMINTICSHRKNKQSRQERIFSANVEIKNSLIETAHRAIWFDWLNKCLWKMGINLWPRICGQVVCFAKFKNDSSQTEPVEMFCKIQELVSFCGNLLLKS